MAKKIVEREVIVCDICGEANCYRKCQICGRDLCSQHDWAAEHGVTIGGSSINLCSDCGPGVTLEKAITL